MSLRPDPKPGGGGQEGPARPRLQPTNPSTLVVAALVTAALSWLGLGRYYGQVPDLNWLPGLTLAGLAVVEGIAAINTWARIDHRPGTQRVNPLLVARYAVLAKASSLAGAIFAGAYGGVAAWALAERGRLAVAIRNLVPSIAGLVGALALVAAALLLERACRVPKPPDDENDRNDVGGGGSPPNHR
jgi:Protein of unknown function (DUF3180)